MNGVHGNDTLQWKVGLMNHKKKYLTAEAFGYKVNASGASMRQKQLWVIEHGSKQEQENVVYIKSHLKRYISTDKKGNIDASNEQPTAECKFSITYHPDGSGKWAFQNISNSYYFGATDDTVQCYEKTPTQSEWWTIRLAVHPQVNLKNVNRKTYVHLNEENDQLQCDEMIPWGCDALITIEFHDGKYAIRSCDNRYLHQDGSLKPDTSDLGTQFTLEIKSGMNSGMAFRDYKGKYLMGVGKDAVLKSRGGSIGKDELFTLEDSHPQVFVTAYNGKKVSIKQGVDVTANQEDLTDKETFQIEFDKTTSMWRFRATSGDYWSLESFGIRAVGNKSSGTGLFAMEWLRDGFVALKASNGKYVKSRANGSLFATADDCLDKTCNYVITVINRPILVLMCNYGFVGFKSPSNPRLECNKASVDCICMEHDEGRSGKYFLKGRNNKYWNVDEEGNINADSATPKPFILEMHAQSRWAIKAPNGNYIKGEQNGIVSAKSPDLSKATLWEY